MPKTKHVCVQCGCERSLTLVAKVEDNETDTTFGLRRLCFPCLLRFAHYDIDAPTEEGKKSLYKCIE